MCPLSRFADRWGLPSRPHCCLTLWNTQQAGLEIEQYTQAESPEASNFGFDEYGQKRELISRASNPLARTSIAPISCWTTWAAKKKRGDAIPPSSRQRYYWRAVQASQAVSVDGPAAGDGTCLLTTSDSSAQKPAFPVTLRVTGTAATAKVPSVPPGEFVVRV